MFTDRISTKALDVTAKVIDLAKTRGMTSSQFALLWLKDQPGVTAPIIGPRTLEHLQDHLNVIDKTLNIEDRSMVDNLVHPGNAVADFFNSNDWMKARIL